MSRATDTATAALSMAVMLIRTSEHAAHSKHCLGAARSCSIALPSADYDSQALASSKPSNDVAKV